MQVKVTKVKKDSVEFTFNCGEYSMPVRVLSDGISRLHGEIKDVFDLVGVG